MNHNAEDKAHWVIDGTMDRRDFDVFAKFNISLFYKQQQKAVNKAAARLKQNIQDALRKDMPSAAQKSAGSKYKDRLIDAVRIGRWRGSQNVVQRSVHIMGIRSKESGTFRLRFYEGGVQRGTQGQPTWRGVLPALWFFKEGTQKTPVGDIIKEHLINVINNANKE